MAVVVNKLIPEFEAVATGGIKVTNQSHNGQVMVLYFYPKDNTPGCTTEGLDFNARLAQFEALGYTVAGISRDSVKSHQNFCAKQGFQFELLSDQDETVCKLFDVIKLKKLYGKESLGIERSTFVLDKNGEIAHEWRKVKVAGHAQEVLDTLSQ
jgi:peroxiredoxin Q/BCP